MLSNAEHDKNARTLSNAEHDKNAEHGLSIGNNADLCVIEIGDEIVNIGENKGFFLRRPRGG